MAGERFGVQKQIYEIRSKALYTHYTRQFLKP